MKGAPHYMPVRECCARLLIREILERYSDAVEERGKGEEVKFLLAIDGVKYNMSRAIHLFNHLTGNGRPLLMIVADRGDMVSDFSEDCPGLERKVSGSDFYFLNDSLRSACWQV